MNPIGYRFYMTAPSNGPRPDAATAAMARSPAFARAKHERDTALGVLLMTIIAGVPVLIVAVFLLLFKI